MVFAKNLYHLSVDRLSVFYSKFVTWNSCVTSCFWTYLCPNGTLLSCLWKKIRLKEVQDPSVGFFGFFCLFVKVLKHKRRPCFGLSWARSIEWSDDIVTKAMKAESCLLRMFSRRESALFARCRWNVALSLAGRRGRIHNGEQFFWPSHCCGKLYLLWKKGCSSLLSLQVG